MNIKTYCDKFYSQPNYKEHTDKAEERLGELVKQLPYYPKVLDIACGDGLFTKLYLKKYPEAHVIGIDISSVAVRLAEKNCPEGIFLIEDIYQSKFRPEKFDAVFCSELLEHSDTPEVAIEEIYRILKNNGAFYTTFPDPTDEYNEKVISFDKDGNRESKEYVISRDMFKQFSIVREFKVGRHSLYLYFKKS